MQRANSLLLLLLMVSFCGGALAQGKTPADQAAAKKAKKLKDSQKASDSLLQESRIRVNKITLLMIRENKVLGRLLGSSAEKREDGSVVVDDALFHFYPAPAKGAKGKLASPRASIAAGKLVWFQADNKLEMLDGVKAVFGTKEDKPDEAKEDQATESPKLNAKAISINADAMTLEYELESLADKKTKKPLVFTITKAKEVVLNGVGLRSSAPEMKIKVSLAAQKSIDDLSLTRLQSLELEAAKGALTTFPKSLLRSVESQGSLRNILYFQARSGGKTTLSLKRGSGAFVPLRMRMVGGVVLDEFQTSQASRRLMSASTVELFAHLYDSNATSVADDRLRLMKLSLLQDAKATLNELEAKGDNIEIDLSNERVRKVVLSIGAELEIRPNLKDGSAQIEDLDRVQLKAKREIQILETIGGEDQKESSTLSASEDAEATFTMHDGSFFLLRGNELVFTLEGSIDRNKDGRKERYSLRNLVKFRCIGSGVRPLMRWMVNGKRRLALFCASLETSRAEDNRLRIDAKGERVRVAMLTNEAFAGLSNVIAYQSFSIEEIWLRSLESISVTLPNDFFDQSETSAKNETLSIESRGACHYEEMIAGGATVNAVHAARVSLDVLLPTRGPDNKSARIRGLVMVLEGEAEKPVRMGIGSDIVVCHRARLSTSISGVEASLIGNVETWIHEEAFVEKIGNLLRDFHGGAEAGGERGVADLVVIKSPRLSFSRASISEQFTLSNAETLDLQVLKSERVLWGLGDDAITEHTRVAGVKAKVLGTLKAGVINIRLGKGTMHAATSDRVSVLYFDSWIRARGFRIERHIEEEELELNLRGPVVFFSEAKEQALILQTLGYGTSAKAKRKSPLKIYGEGVTIRTLGDLELRSTKTSKEIPATKVEPAYTKFELRYALDSPKGISIVGQHSADPLSDEAGRKDSLSADALKVRLLREERDPPAKKATPEANAALKGLPFIEDFRLTGKVEATYGGTSIKGTRLFYNRVSNQFVLGGAKIDTSSAGVEVKGVKRFEVSFPLYGKSKSESKKSSAPRHWRIVGGKIKIRRVKPTSSSESSKEETHGGK